MLVLVLIVHLLKNNYNVLKLEASYVLLKKEFHQRLNIGLFDIKQQKKI